MIAFNATTRCYPTVDRDTLDSVAEWETPFRIEAGRVYDDVFGVHAPEALHVEGAQAPNDVEIVGEGWEPLHGFTGQWGYSGAVMHASETLSGGLADAVLAEDGIYVLTSVECLDDPENPAGWVVLRRTEVVSGTD